MTDFCSAAYPVYLKANESLDDSNARKVMMMDLYGESHCGWKRN